VKREAADCGNARSSRLSGEFLNKFKTTREFSRFVNSCESMHLFMRLVADRPCGCELRSTIPKCAICKRRNLQSLTSSRQDHNRHETAICRRRQVPFCSRRNAHTESTSTRLLALPDPVSKKDSTRPSFIFYAKYLSSCTLNAMKITRKHNTP